MAKYTSNSSEARPRCSSHGQTVAPDLVAKDEADRTVEIMRGAHYHARRSLLIPCSTATTQI